MQVRVYNSISGANRGGRKLPMNDAGIAVIENDVKESLELGQQNGFVDTFSVTVPKAANISSANKAARTLTDVKFQFTVQGAIHKVAPITGVVSV
jgi:hypothetical protein